MPYPPPTRHVVTLDGVALLEDLHLAGQKADVADVVLRTGMMASSQVDVDRAIERNTRLAVAGDILGMTLGVRCGEFASDIAGTGDEIRRGSTLLWW